MKKFFAVIMFVSLLVAGCSQSNDEQVELIISSAASLQHALNDIQDNFEKEHPHVKVFFNYGGSGSLQQQILYGAPVDVFFSASESKFNTLVDNEIIEISADLVGNEIVLVVPHESNIATFTDLHKTNTISIGTPETVPAGKYAQEALTSMELWDTVSEKVVYAKDVRQVLTYVETGNVDAGIVYKTDALSSDKVKVVATADQQLHTPIIYPVGIIKSAIHQDEAKLFFDYIQNEESIKILEKYGFKGLD
nr:molybdate ABC transporter substrate-binding protein [Paenibacillus bovis]